MLPTAEEKRRIIERRIVNELRLFQEQHKTGMKIQVLACKYAKATAELGGFPDFIEAMRVSGLLHVEYADNGARTVSLAQGPAPAKVWF